MYQFPKGQGKMSHHGKQCDEGSIILRMGFRPLSLLPVSPPSFSQSKVLSEHTRRVGNSNFNMTWLPGARARDAKVAAGAERNRMPFPMSSMPTHLC